MNKHLRLSVRNFRVDKDAGRLTDLALITAGREATGHGIYIDERTLSTALDSVKAKGGKLKAYIAHPTFDEYFNGEDRILEVPGWFEELSIKDGKLTAGVFTFYDSFRSDEPKAYARLMEMADKTPELFGLSIEAYGYGVFVAASGTEYTGRPDEDEELLYEGMPAFRVTQLEGAAFVGEPAANEGLFASAVNFLRRKAGGLSEADAKLLSAAFAAHQPAPAAPASHSSDNDKSSHRMKELIKALKAKYKDDQARLSRALMIVANTEDSDSLTLSTVEQVLSAVEQEAELKELRAKAAEADKLKQERDALDLKFKQIKESGLGEELNLGAPALVGLSAKSGATQKVLAHMQSKNLIHANFAVTTVADLWVPEVWIQGLSEEVPILTDFMGSGVVVRSPVLSAAATAGGTSINIPNFRAPDHADAPQIQGTGPTINAVTSGLQIAPRISRVNTLGVSAMAAGLSGSDPVGYAFSQITQMRNRNRLRCLIAQLRGLFGTGSHAFSANRVDSFEEDDATPAAGNIFGSDHFYDGAGRLGELKSSLENGALLVHPDVETSLSKQDDISFEKPSNGDFRIRVYKKTIPVYVSSLLVRDGDEAGKVYDSYLFAPQTVGEGFAPQSNRVGDISSLTVKEDEHLNEVAIYDRTSGFLHPNGARWTGTPANAHGGPTDAELATPGNWALAAQHSENIGIVQWRTNA